VILVATAAVLPAAPLLACPQSGTLADLIAFGVAGCQVYTAQGAIQDKIFSNFSYSGTVASANINVTQVLQTGTSDVHGWSFVPDTAWVTGFTLSYMITVTPGNPLVALVQSKDQINSGAVPNGIIVNDTQTGVTPSPIVTQGTIGGETAFSNTYNLQSITTTSIATIPANKNLLSYEQDFFEGSTIPEPMSFVLIGTGLLGLGLLRRRVRKS
jgi:hypothetical protein